MAKINEYPLERFTFGDDDYYDIDYWDGAVYQSAKIKGSTIRAAMSGGGSILAADGQVMPADRSQDLANFKLSLRDGVFTLGTVDADFGSIFQATKDSGNTYATIKTKTNDNAALILDINTADVTGAGNKTAFIQFRDAGVSKYIFGTNTDGVANFSDNSFFISSSAQLTDYIQAIDRDTESFVIGRQIGNPLNENTKFLINNGNSFDTTELDNVLMLSSRDETKKWSVDKDMFFSATKIKGDSASGVDTLLELQDNTGATLWDFRNNGDLHLGQASTIFQDGLLTLNAGTDATTGFKGVKLDATNITGAANSTLICSIDGQSGEYFSMSSQGSFSFRSYRANLIGSLLNSTGDQGITIKEGTNQISTWHSDFIQLKGQSTDGFINQFYQNNTIADYQQYSTGSVLEQWIRTAGGNSIVNFFRQGIKGSGFIVGGDALISTEDVSLQGNTYIGGYLELQNGLKHLGYTSSTAAPTTTELPNDKDYSIHKDTSAGTVYLAYNDGGVIKTTTLT